MSNKTGNTVPDGKLSDTELGGLHRKFSEITRRLNEGTIGLSSTMQGLQNIIEGRGMTPNWPIWKTIEIGTHKDVKSLRKALEGSGARISDWAGDILAKTKLSKSKQSLDLVVLSVKELGFPQGAQLKDIYEAANNQDLDKCPAEVGPQLRLQYPYQPIDEWLTIAMEPIKVSGGDLGLFRVKLGDGGRWLRAYDGDPGLHWDAGYRFVFVRRK
jgi:hypothetical protein